MKPLIMKTNLPVPPLSDFRNFTAAILRKWIFLLFLALDVLALLFQLTGRGFFLPQSYYIGFIFFGFAVSAFQVYRELSSVHQKLLSKPVEKIPKSELSVSFPVGNEYTYSLADPYTGQDTRITRMQNTKGVECRFDERGILYVNDVIYYAMGQGNLEINLRLVNSGDVQLDVSAIRSANNVDLRYLDILDDGILLDGLKLRCPLHLKSGEFVTLRSKYKIVMGKTAGEAEFAADTQSLPNSILHEISFDTVDAEGKKQTYISKIATPSKPLIDLYAKQWREYDQEDYLVIAGYGLAPDK
jgi:hypothetical protein